MIVYQKINHQQQKKDTKNQGGQNGGISFGLFARKSYRCNVYL